MKELGELVRTHRENAGIYNQRDFSLAIGKAQSWVSRLESGALKETPAPEDMRLITNVLGLPAVDMLRAAGYDVTTGKEGDHPVIAAIRPIVEGREFTDVQMRDLADMVRMMVRVMEG